MNLGTCPTAALQRIAELADALRPMADELGLTMHVWDAAGRCVAGGARQTTRFCQHVCGGACRSSVQTLAESVLQNGAPASEAGTIGCCLIGLPVRDRRRLTGAIVLGYPTRQMSDEEHLARVCAKRELDLQVIQDAARTDLRHAAEEAPRFAQLFTTLIAQYQQSQEAGRALTSLSVNLANSYEELSLLYRVSGSMRVSQDPRGFLQDTCDQIRDVLDAEVAAAVVFDTRTQLGEDIVVRSGSTVDSAALRLLAATYLTPRLREPTDAVICNDYTDDGPLGHVIRRVLAVPLVIDRETVGTLLALNCPEADFDSSDAKLISSIASQASVFLANSRMYAELQDLLMGVLHSLTEAIDAKDPYTCGHSRRVAAISRRLAEACGFDEGAVRNVHLAGLLHDVGKIGVPEAILCKDGRLTDEEYDIIKRHPAIGARILRRIRHLEPIVAGVMHHHERIDGRGYPDGLRGNEIPIEGRIIGLADSWDAMTSKRTYRNALSLDRAAEEIRRCSGDQFDPKLAELFLSWDLEAYMQELHASNVQDLHLLDERRYL